MMDASVSKQFEDCSRQIDQSVRGRWLEEGGRTASVRKCPNIINKCWLTGGNKSAGALISKGD